MGSVPGSPAPGAEINITSVPAPANLRAFVRQELKGATIRQLGAAETPAAAIRASYTQELARDATLSNVVLYVPHGATLYQFYFLFPEMPANAAEPVQAVKTTETAGPAGRGAAAPKPDADGTPAKPASDVDEMKPSLANGSSECRYTWFCCLGRRRWEPGRSGGCRSGWPHKM